MNKRRQNRVRIFRPVLAVLVWTFTTATAGMAQNFDFKTLEKKAHDYTVIIDLKLEVSFGKQTNEQVDRLLGTIVSEDGLIMFPGAALASDAAFSSMAGMMVKTTPVKIDITALDKKKYQGQFVGVDRFTSIGFARITNGERKFSPVRFKPGCRFRVGAWVTLYMLLPEFVNPPVAADVGMISTIVQSPESFPLTVGFNPLQIASVLYDENLEPVGVLGELANPSAATDQGGMLDSFHELGVPLLGVIIAERLNKIIANPPQKGEIDRGWLGITLQALTADIAESWDLKLPGGIIVNEIATSSPAEKAGLQVGDIIYRINQQPVEINKEEEIPVFQRRIAEMGPNTQVTLSVLRPKDESIDTVVVPVTLEKAPLAATEAADYESQSLEFKVRNMVFADYMFYQVDPQTFTGVVVSELKPGGLADVGGLELGDVIQRIGSRQVGSVDAARSALERIETDRPVEVIFFVWRDNRTLFVSVKTDWH